MGMQIERETTYTFTCDVCGATRKIYKGDPLLGYEVLDSIDARKLARSEGWVLGKRVIKCPVCAAKKER